MEHGIYERPRERLQRNGATMLTTVELLQVLIGSGNSKVSGARIAKNVASILESSSLPTYEVLLPVQGLGHAKVCQILASIELGARLLHMREEPSISMDISHIREKAKATLYCEFINSLNAVSGSFTGVLRARGEDGVMIKRMFGEALGKGARSIDIAVGWRRQDIQTMDMPLLDLLHKIYDTADLLQIRIKSFHLVNKSSERLVKRKAII